VSAADEPSDAAPLDDAASVRAQARDVADSVALTIVADGLEPATPPPFDALLGSLPEARHSRFAAQVAHLLDVHEDAAQEMLHALDATSSWQAGFLPGMELFHVEGGASVADAITGFVRLPAGAHFPDHRHLGDESVLILQGYCCEADETVGPGALLERPAGSAHSFDVLEGGTSLLYLAIVHEGLEVGDMVLRADDPRA